MKKIIFILIAALSLLNGYSQNKNIAGGSKASDTTYINGLLIAPHIPAGVGTKAIRISADGRLFKADTVTYGQVQTGTYTPTLTNTTNVSASTAYLNQWFSVTDPTTGVKVTTVSGYVAIDAITNTTATTITMTLPTACVAANGLGGTFSCRTIAGLGGGISSTGLGGTASFSFITNDIANNTFYFTFTYLEGAC